MGSDTPRQRGFGAATSAVARALTAALGDAVILPEEPEYANAMGRLFSSEASLANPVCILQPKDSAHVATALKVARDFGCPVTVRGGSHSALCAADQAVMIDLSAHCGQVSVIGDDVRIGGGATMGAVLDSLAPQSRFIPVGVARTPGMGLALQGGVGYLTRSFGLTLDCIRAVEMVMPSGEVLKLSETSTGDEADLWWAVRGCAPNLGVVTSVTMRSFASPARVFSQRLLLRLDALPRYVELAPALPRNISASAVLGPAPGGPRIPFLFLYIVHAGDDAEGMGCVQEMAHALIRHSGAAPLLEHGATYSYHAMPPMDVPALSGFEMGAPADPATSQRVFTFKKSPFLKFLDTAAGAGLVEAIRAAPTSWCRVDLQQCGGVLGDVSPSATAFWNRGFEWNCPVIGGWTGLDGEREACADWVRQTVQLLAPSTVGMYSVEITPELPETAKEVEQAFGGNLARLRRLKRKWDPDNLFRLYYPI